MAVKKQVSDDGPLAGPMRVWGWVLLGWSLYRWLFVLPEPIDELVFKPLVFLLPVLWYVFRVEKRSLASLGFTTKNLFPSLYIGIGIGMVFALQGMAANFIKNGELLISPINAFKEYGFLLLGITIATSVWEETLGRGFLYQRFEEIMKGNMVKAALLSAVLMAMLHVPVLVTSLHYQGMTLVIYFLTGVVLSLANAILYRYTRSLVGPILVHVFWNMAVALYL